MMFRFVICSVFVLYAASALNVPDKGPRVGQAVSADTYNRSIVEWGVNHLSICNSSDSTNTSVQNNCTITGVYDYSRKVVAGFKHFFRVEFKTLNAVVYKCEMTILEQSWLNLIKYSNDKEPICQLSDSTTSTAAVKAKKRS